MRDTTRREDCDREQINIYTTERRESVPNALENVCVAWRGGGVRNDGKATVGLSSSAAGGTRGGAQAVMLTR
eukprot:6353438-Pyramimonas_sp.AAC.1